MGWRARAIVGLCVVGASMVSVSSARAGNEESLFFGGEATLSAGALMAITNEAGAAWYNPAGLAPIRRHRVSLSGTAFSFRMRPLPGTLRLEPTGGDPVDGDLGSVEFRVIPSGVTIARNLGGRLTVAFCMFISERDSLFARSTVRGSGEAAPGLRTSVLAHADLWRIDDTYNIGAAVAWEVSPTLRLGVSGFVLFERHRGRARVYSQVDPPEGSDDTHTLDLDDGEFTDIVIGGFARFGVQWEPAPGWHLGVLLRTPTATFTRYGDASGLDIGASTIPLFGDEVAARFAESSPGDRPFALVVPFEARLGVACSGPWGWVGVEGAIRPPLRDEERGIDEELLWNARAGGIFTLTRTLSLGGGLFTDNSTLGEPASLLWPAVDYYGATLGIRIRSAHRVDDDPRPDRLIFTTTLALRYAIGVGQTARALVNPLADGEAVVVLDEQDVLFHEVSLLMGSSILF